MKHALFIAFHYPPEAGSSGVLRTLKFTRYLADHGWQSTVVSPERSAYDTVDEAMTGQMAPSTRVVRTRYLHSKRSFGICGRYFALTALPDVWIGWLPFAVAASLRVAREDPFDLIFSSSPPATSHLIATIVGRWSGKPYVVDFRDPWFEDVPEPGAPSGAAFRRLDRWLERKAVEGSARVVTTTDTLRQTLAARYAHLPQDRFLAVPNGYDEADFGPATALSRRAASRDRLCLLHAGSINPDFRDPLPLVQAIRAAADAGKLDPRRLVLRFLGPGDHARSPRLRQAIERAGLVGSIEFVDRLPYAEALAEIAAADVLVLLQASEDTRALIPAKLFEYLRAQRFVLAVTLPGETSRLLEATGGGVAVDPADGAALVRELSRLYQAWREGAPPLGSADLGVLRRYDRRELTARLAAVFDAVTGS